jgi:hypothetical protein
MPLLMTHAAKPHPILIAPTTLYFVLVFDVMGLAISRTRNAETYSANTLGS